MPNLKDHKIWGLNLNGSYKATIGALSNFFSFDSASDDIKNDVKIAYAGINTLAEIAHKSDRINNVNDNFILTIFFYTCEATVNIFLENFESERASKIDLCKNYPALMIPLITLTCFALIAANNIDPDIDRKQGKSILLDKIKTYPDAPSWL